MLLYYKAWRESRGRFLLTGVVLAGYCISFVQAARLEFPPRIDPFMPYSTFIWHGIYSGPSAPIFTIVSFALGLGGLQRERDAGSSGFTLALPVSRARLVVTRACVGLIEMAILATIPAAIVPWLSPLYAAQSYPIAAAIRFALLFSCVGAVWLGVGVLTSTLFFSEYAGVVAAVLVPALYGVAVDTSPLKQFASINLTNVMNGAHMPNFDAATSLFVGPLPWMALLSALALAGTFIVAATRLTQQQDL